MKALLTLLLILLLAGCKVTQPQTFKYKVVELESDTEYFTNRIPQFNEVKQDVEVYKLVNNRFIKIVTYYE